MFRFKIILISAVIILFITESCDEALNPMLKNQANSDDSAVITSGPSSLAKATTVMTKDTINEYWRLWGECLSETLAIYYSDELIAHTTIDNKGGYHTVMHWRPINTIAYGVESGNSWIPVGAVPIIQHYGKVGEVFTQSGCYNWKAQQKGPSLIEPWTLHYTVNANGVMTVNREVYRFICK